MKKNNCSNLSLSEFIPSDQNPWDEKKILFLFRRLEFGIDKSNINAYLNYSPQDLIDKIVDDAKNLIVSPDPGWKDWNAADFNNSGKNRGAFFRDHQRLVFDDFLKNGFRERLTLFWSNHFVTEYYMYNHPAYAFIY